MNDGFLSFARTGAGQRFLAEVSRIANALVAIANQMERVTASGNESREAKEAQDVSHR